MQGNVHLGKGFLHMLDVAACGFDQVVAMAQITSQHADLIEGTKATAKQPVGMQLLQPLAVGYVGLAAGYIFHMARVAQDHFKSSSLQDLENGYPSNCWSIPLLRWSQHTL